VRKISYGWTGRCKRRKFRPILSRSGCIASFPVLRVRLLIAIVVDGGSMRRAFALVRAASGDESRGGVLRAMAWG